MKPALTGEGGIEFKNKTSFNNVKSQSGGKESMLTLIKKDTLNQLFNDGDKMRHHEKGQCHFCGDKVSIRIDKLQGSYGFSGGAICEEADQKIFVICENCYNRKRNLKA